MSSNRKGTRGQVIVMVTVALVLMLGMLGLAVDLGFSYFTKKAAQAAADAAALGAVNEAFARAGEGPYSCAEEGSTTGLSCAERSCTTPLPGRPTDNLTIGCLHSDRNGFRTSGRQTVKLEGGVWDGVNPVSPPTVPGVKVYYWVTARVSERMPQLFSSVLGNYEGTSAARATAAIIDAPVLGSLLLLNREKDPVPAGRGVDLSGGGNSNVYGGSGILLASAASGGPYAGDSHSGSGGGTVRVSAPFTYIRATGAVNPSLEWTSTTPGMPGWQNGFRDRSYFKDPLRGIGQPPPPSGLFGPSTDFPIPGGVINGSADPDNPKVLKPGYYYAVTERGGSLVATGNSLVINGYVRFSAAPVEGNTIPRTTPPAAFGDWVFFGGVQFDSNTVATFDPGRYVFAGVKPQTNGPGNVFSFGNQVVLEDHTPLDATGRAQPNRPGDAGEIFIFTDATYVGWDAETRTSVPLEIPPLVEPIKSRLQFGVANIQAGNNSSTRINLHGLNNEPSDTVGYRNVPQELNNFRPVVLWQDQRNSRVRYSGAPEFDVDISSCDIGEDGVSAPSINNPCGNSLADWDSPEMRVQATPNTHLYGAIYQPRGAWLVLQGSGVVTSPLQLVTGSLDVQGGPTVTLTALHAPLQRRIVALIE